MLRAKPGAPYSRAAIRSFDANGVLEKIDFSTDLTNWSTIEVLND